MEPEHINKIIPQLLDKSIKHNKEILNRFTICDYFSTFESRNSKELLKYIQESNNRYKATKSGNKISSVVVRSEDALKPISEHILTDNYYVNFNIEKERKQLKHKLNTKENKKIGQLMKKIKESTNTYSKSELNYRNKLNKILETKKKNSSKDVNKNHTVEKWNEVNLNLRTKEMIEQQNERNLKTVNDIFNEDDKAFNEEINNHIELLRELKEYICSKEKVHKDKAKFFGNSLLWYHLGVAISYFACKLLSVQASLLVLIPCSIALLISYKASVPFLASRKTVA